MEVKNLTIKELLTKYREISLLGKVSATLNWDLNVNMPPKAAQGRSEQLAYLAGVITEKWLESGFRSLFEKALEEKDLSEHEQAIVRNVGQATKFYYKVPKDLIVKKEEVTSQAFSVWSKAREENDFSKFEPFLTQIVELNKEIAGHLGYKENPYDALLDLHEPELTAADCERLFDGMKGELVSLMGRITSSKEYPEVVRFVNGETHYMQEKQKELSTRIAKKMGFDFTSGHLSVSPHPFTTELGPNDVRLTTMYNDTDFRESYLATVHEAGHGLYEQNINPEYMMTPLEGGVSLGIHESLSRFWENMIGKNPLFLENITPMLKETYSEQLRSLGVGELSRIVNHVKPSLIRIHADEVSYSLHIILRFEMENALMNGEITVKDSPEAWREKSKKLLGVAPETDKEGILQDVHWTYGEIGYFPSYALGNVYGAQFLNAMKKNVDFDKEVGAGNLSSVKDWLDKNVHTHGSLYFPKELLKRATGESLNHQYFIDYLREKYSAIYRLEE